MNKEQALQACTVEGTVIKLPEEQLDRKVYMEVKKALELIGGKWKGGKVFGFVFQEDPTELLSQVANGENRNLKKEFQFFATPPTLADYLVELSELEDNDIILEPSAGQGAIIEAINKLSAIIPDCYELMDINRTVLQHKQLSGNLTCNIIGHDFMEPCGKRYSKIIANPPFTKNQDIEHLTKMYDLLYSGGRLVCITSTSWVTGSQKKQVAFRDWLDQVGAEVLDIEPGTFKESGTMVGGKIVIINKY